MRRPTGNGRFYETLTQRQRAITTYPMPLSDDQIDQVIEALETATEENKVASARAGQVVHLPAEGELWVTGDLHDHRRNFEKFVVAADLANNPRRHVVLHEMIHGDHFDENRAEDSWQMLYWAADLKCAFSSQVHFLFANHDLAQIHGEGIMKAGLGVCEAFNAGVKRDFGSRRSAAHVAITEMLLSFPLAIRTRNGLFISHSIPTDEQIPKFDYTVFERALTGEDYRRRTGAVYQLVWGRKMSPESAAAFADRMGARILVTGHQPQESGYAINGDRHIILASDHNQGVFLPLSLSEIYDMSGVAERVSKFVSLSLPDPEPVADSDEGVEPGLGEPDPAADASQVEVAESAESEASVEQPAVAAEAANIEPELPPPATNPVDGAGGLPVPEPPQPPPIRSHYQLPDERQREAFGDMIADVLAEISMLGWDGKSAQAADLADAFHNLPRDMYGRGTWNGEVFRSTLEKYQQKYAIAGQSSRRNYVAWFDRIMGTD